VRKIVILAVAVLTQMVVAGGAALASETPLPTIARPATARRRRAAGMPLDLVVTSRSPR
jgi:hypothetical protein